MRSFYTDGRWVTDDYYEAKILEEITERGLKAGELVGELPDPNAVHHNNELSALNAAAATSSKPDRGGGGGGLYRAGGPTTIFGGSGLGPFSDGPLNAVRKSLLTRDGVAEENWLWMMAMRVSEANEEWAKQRKEAVKSMQTLMGGPVPPTPAPLDDAAANGAGEPQAKKRRVVQDQPVLGAYEPHSNIIQCTCPHSSSCRTSLIFLPACRSLRYAADGVSLGATARLRRKAKCARWNEGGQRRVGAGLDRHCYGISGPTGRRCAQTRSGSKTAAVGGSPGGGGSGH